LSVPLLERLKFLGIFSSNLDEFYSVRVGSLNRVIRSGEAPPETFFGGTPKKVLKKIIERTRFLRDVFEGTLVSIFDEMREEGIVMVDEKGLSEQESRYVERFFAEQVRPRLVPIMLENVDCFPFLHSLVIYLAVAMEKDAVPDSKYALIEVPADVLSRFVRIPGHEKRTPVILLDDIIRFGLKDIFSTMDYDRISAYTIKMTRDSELDLETDLATSFFEQVSRSLKTRGQGSPVRFVYDEQIHKGLLKTLIKELDLPTDIMISGGRYHNARDMISFPSPGTQYARLRYRNPEPLEHPLLRQNSSVLKAMEGQDILLHYPYQSFQHVVDLLREAAIDKDVTSIRMTLYRVADDSQIVNALKNAIRNGKKVTAFVEIQARFDEEANIHWTEELAREGADVIVGIPTVKIHSKLLLITKRAKKDIRRYAYIGTGNFNEATAKVYTDHGLLTCDPAITNEVRNIFTFLKDHYKTFTYRHLLVSPFQMEKRLAKLIRNEIKNAQGGREAYIKVKINGLSHKKMIDRLYKAGQNGVRIEMIIRGICCLVPGVEGLSENIEVLSVVDKYLEHSRIFIFANGGDPLVYIGSADWMPRNLERRMEVATPILDESLKRELIDYFDIQSKDNVKARVINGLQDNSERNTDGRRELRSQVEIYRYLRKRQSSERPEEEGPR